jgi:hypothetical protein
VNSQPDVPVAPLSAAPAGDSAAADTQPAPSAVLVVSEPPAPADAGTSQVSTAAERQPLALVVRVLVVAVAGPVLASYAATVAIVALLSITAGAPWSLAGTLANAAAFWLAAHQVPLMIAASGGVSAPLGLLPLLPTIGLALLVARSARAAGERLDLATRAGFGVLVGAFSVGHGAVGALLAAMDPAPQLAVDVLPAFFGCAAIAGLAAVIGAARVQDLARLTTSLLPAWVLHGVRAGALGLCALLAAGAVVTLGGLVASVGAAHEVLDGWESFTGGQLGVTVLSVAYLPNALVAGLSWIAGPGFAVGGVAVSPFGTTAGSLPAVPLLAALPEPGPAPWRVMVFALPLLAAVLVGRSCRRFSESVTDRLHAVVTAGGSAAAACFVLAVLAGGRLGGAAFDPMRIPPASLAIAVFVWLALPASLIVAMSDYTRVVPGDLTGDSDPDVAGTGLAGTGLAGTGLAGNAGPDADVAGDAPAGNAVPDVDGAGAQEPEINSDPDHLRGSAVNAPADQTSVIELDDASAATEGGAEVAPALASAVASDPADRTAPGRD